MTQLKMRQVSFDQAALVQKKKHMNATALPTEAKRVEAPNQFENPPTIPGLHQCIDILGNLIQKVGQGMSKLYMRFMPATRIGSCGPTVGSNGSRTASGRTDASGDSCM